MRRLNSKDEKQSFLHLFKAIVLSQGPAVPVTVDRDLHCGSSAHDTVCHAGASQGDREKKREIKGNKE